MGAEQPRRAALFDAQGRAGRWTPLQLQIHGSSRAAFLSASSCDQLQLRPAAAAAVSARTASRRAEFAPKLTLPGPIPAAGDTPSGAAAAQRARERLISRASPDALFGTLARHSSSALPRSTAVLLFRHSSRSARSAPLDVSSPPPTFPPPHLNLTSTSFALLARQIYLSSHCHRTAIALPFSTGISTRASASLHTCK
ncbi:hypothetical protein PaG_05406 [Moesziomyces aphidis]|uniref:Uncharacterized protein n=1 Tax=Moesziomyces aphidis TaxID=84754 RepID=W3VII5_MOEAP|nr:hypothetical protein PaG_05406 [Moesziomyces aphidis]